MTIETQQVHWQGQFLLPDTADPGDEPDTLPLEGHVSFSPVWDERISGFLSDTVASIHVRVFTFELRDGKLMSRDGDDWVSGVKIPSRIGGVTLSWVAKFDVKAKGNAVPARDISFTSNPGGSVSLVDMVPAEAIYPRFSPDVVRGDSVEDITLAGEYLTFIVGKGTRAQQKVVKLPLPDQAELDARYVHVPGGIADGQVLAWDAATGTWFPRSTGELVGHPAGTTAQRPPNGPVGMSYFDTTLGKPVWLKTASVGGTPAVWVDATGATAP